MAAPYRPPFVPNDLAPAHIRATRKALARSRWRETATTLAVLIELVVGVAAVPTVPFLLVLLDPWIHSPELWLAAIAAGGATLAVGGLGVAEWIRRDWRVRGKAIEAELAPYIQPVTDPRWRDAQTLLVELRGPDPDSEVADVVYDLTLVLVQAFRRRARIADATKAAQAMGDEGVESLAALLEQHDVALNRTLVELKRSCALALREPTDAIGAAAGLLKDLRLGLDARAEVDQVAVAEDAPRDGVRAAAARQRVLEP